MDHLGVDRFLFMGLCIGGPFGLKLMERAPERVVAGVLCQPVGSNKATPDAMHDGGVAWAAQLLPGRPDISELDIHPYLHNLYRREATDFVYSVSRDFVRACQTPILVMPDDTDSHGLEVAMEVAEIAPNAEKTVYPWKEDPATLAQTIEKVRQWMTTHATSPKL